MNLSIENVMKKQSEEELGSYKDWRLYACINHGRESSSVTYSIKNVKRGYSFFASKSLSTAVDHFNSLMIMDEKSIEQLVKNEANGTDEFKMWLPPDVHYILDKLKENGYQAVVVGGCVRDTLMGEKPHDYDIATSALPDQVQEVFSNERIVESGLKHGTVTVIFNRIPYEITTYRIDGEYSDHRRPDSVEFTKDLKEDLSRRDFTINAIAYDGEKLYDYFGGIDDIKNRIVRCVGDARERFTEDPLRILRAIRFVSKLGFNMELGTQETIMEPKFYNMLDNVSCERKTAEFDKIITGKYSYNALVFYYHVIEKVIPKISTIKDWEETVLKMDGKQYIEKLVFLVEDAYSDFSNMSQAVSDFCYRMKYSNNIHVKVSMIIACQNEIFYDSPIFAREILQKYPIDIVIHAARCKKEKINNNSALQSCANELLCIMNEIINTVSTVNTNETECYLLDHLKVNGIDLQDLGIKGEEIGRWLRELLHLVQIKGVQNKKDQLLNIVKLNIAH